MNNKEIMALSSDEWETEFKGKRVRAYLRPVVGSGDLEVYEGLVVGFELSAHAAFTEERPVPVVGVRLQGGKSLVIERLESIEVI